MSQEVATISSSLAEMNVDEAAGMDAYIQSRIVAFEKLQKEQIEYRQKVGGDPIWYESCSSRHIILAEFHSSAAL